MTVILVIMWGGCSQKSVTKPETSILECPATPVVHSGDATFYTYASGAGACSFDSTPNDLMVGAMNPIDYAGSQLCGAYVSVTGPKGTIQIRIVDLCPGCSAGSIDLSPSAFAKIADTSLGRVPITWQVIPYPSNNPIVYHFKDGSSQWWTAVQIRNHLYPIYSLEYRTAQKTFKSVSRVDYNYFVESGGMGPGPYTFRVTDVYGHVLVDSAITLTPNGDVSGNGQFPPCN